MQSVTDADGRGEGASGHIDGPGLAKNLKAASNMPAEMGSSMKLSRRKMRQGTHSCIECRRRKIKCTSRGDSSKSCQECFIRGLKCVDQRHGVERGERGPEVSASSKQNPVDLQRRVAELEGLLKQVLQRLPGESQHEPQQETQPLDREVRVDCSCKPELEPMSPALTVRDRSSSSEVAVPDGDTPVSLFSDNVFFNRDDVSVNNGGSLKPFGGKNCDLTMELRALLPPPQTVRRIMCVPLGRDITSRYQFLETGEGVEPEALSDCLSQTNNPITVAKGLLAIATCLHHLPDEEGYSRMFGTVNHADVIERYSSVVEEKVMSNEDLAVTIDGIECGYILAEFHITAGRPRRAWLSIRRSLGHAQMLGLHHMIMTDPKSHKQCLDKRRKTVAWAELAWKDVVMSLFLGLPHSTPDQFIVPQLLKAAQWLQWDDTKIYGLELTSVITQIISRNQEPSLMTFSHTMKIDEEQEVVARTRKGEWWDYCKPEFADRDVMERLGHIFAYICHHLTRVLLHMPFMLKSSQDQRYNYSLMATLESARALITCYQTVKATPETNWAACKVLDFWGFISAVILILNLAGLSKNGVSVQSKAQDAADWRMVDETIATLTRASPEPGGYVCEQCAQTLKLLADVRNGPMANMIRVSIPFFGVITIGEGKHFGSPLAAADSNTSHPEIHVQQDYMPKVDNFVPQTTVKKRPREQVSSRPSDVSRPPDLDAGLVTFDNMYGLPPQEPAPAPSVNATMTLETPSGTLGNDSYDWTYWTMMDLDNDWRWDNFGST